MRNAHYNDTVPMVTSSNVVVCPEPKDIQFTLIKLRQATHVEKQEIANV